MRRPLTLAALALLTIAAGALVLPAADAGESTCDWPMYGRDLGHHFAAPDGCTTMSAVTAPSITPRWGMLTADSLTASPTVVDGVAYAGDWTGSFYAVPVDQTGAAAPAWRFDVDDPNGVAFGRIVSSAAVVTVSSTRVVVFAGGATLYVLDARTGDELARLCLDPRADESVRCRGTEDGVQVEVESSPAVVVAPDGGQAQVVIGLDVHNDAGVGRTGIVSSTLHRRDGAWRLAPDWKFDPEGGEDGATYTGDDLLTRHAGTGSGCASVWGSPAIDVPAGLVFFGTGSCGASGVEVGEDAFAVDLETGSLVWRYDTPRVNEDWDDDFGASPNILPGGLVGFGSKDGRYYAFDEVRGGEPRWVAHVGQAGHVTDGFAVGGIIGTPAVGVVGGRPAVFATTALSTPVGEPLDEGHPQRWVDQSLVDDPFRLLSLTAVDATTGAILWRTPMSRQSYGAPTYANGVLLVPSTFSAELLAFHADTGALLSAMPVAGASSSSPTIVGDTIYLGAGTRTSDLEFKAFGASAAEALVGASPLSPLSGLFAYRIVAPELVPAPAAPGSPIAPFGPPTLP